MINKKELQISITRFIEIHQSSKFLDLKVKFWQVTLKTEVKFFLPYKKQIDLEQRSFLGGPHSLYYFSWWVAYWPASYHPLADLLTACSPSRVFASILFPDVKPDYYSCMVWVQYVPVYFCSSALCAKWRSKLCQFVSHGLSTTLEVNFWKSSSFVCVRMRTTINRLVKKHEHLQIACYIRNVFVKMVSPTRFKPSSSLCDVTTKIELQITVIYASLRRMFKWYKGSCISNTKKHNFHIKRR